MPQPPDSNTPDKKGATHGDHVAEALERQLAGLQDQFALLKAQVRQAQQLSNLGTAATMIAHEVNNLLTPVYSYAKTALDADDDHLQKRALSITLRNVQMLIAMSDRILKISAAKPPKRECVNVRGVVDDAAASLCRDLSKDGIDFIVDVDATLAVWADALELQQVLFNLFLNARQVMAPSHSGRLNVSASRQGQYVAIRVRNTGEPIPGDLLPHIFDSFASSKSSRRHDGARCSGLGLALCRDLVQENKGTINVVSGRESGTVFTITLPAAEAS